MAREEENAFTRAVLADPAAPDPYVVYGDWLQTQGDPRGELIAIQTALASRPSDRGLKRRERELLAAYGATWIGPRLAPIATCDWRHGFVRSIVLDVRDCEPLERVVHLAELDGRTLEELELVSSDLSAATLATLAALLPTYPNLQSLVLWFGAGDADTSNLARVLDALPPKLRRLGLRRTTFTAEVVALLLRTPRVREFETIDLAWGNLNDGQAERARAELGERLHVGVQYDPERAADLREQAEAGLRSVLVEEGEYEAFDSEFRGNPYSPWSVADARLAVAELAPFLTDMLAGASGTWALHALEHLGARAGPAASDAIAARPPSAAFFAVDEARARRRGIHRQAPLREAIAQRVESRGREAHGTHLADLLASDDADVLLFALGQQGYGDDSFIGRAADKGPEHLPVDMVRDLLEHPDARVRSGAAAVLATLHLPEDAGPVLAAIVGRGARVKRVISTWLGSHPRSDELIPSTENLWQVFEIVRRRRCAGITTDLALVRDRVHAALTAGPAKHDHGRWRDIGAAAKIVEELHAVELAPALAQAIGPVEGARRFEGEGRFDELRPALFSLGDAGMKAVEEAHARATEERRTRLGWMRDELRQPRHELYTLEEADKRFTMGKLEDGLLVDNAAYGYYANVLLRDPRSAHAALQCARIERGFGAWMNPERIAWLRSLGVPERQLEILAERPRAILTDYTFSHHGSSKPDPARATRALLAGLPGAAVHYIADGSDEQKRATELARSLCASAKG